MNANFAKSPRRWFRFSLRTLFVVMLLLGVALGVLAWMAGEAKRQRKVVADLEKLGAEIYLSDEEPLMPGWLDTGYCRRVEVVIFYDAQDAHLPLMTEFKNLKQLDLAGTPITDAAPLAELNSLEYLNLAWTSVADVMPLAELKRLVTLNLAYNRSVADVMPLAELKRLETLYLQGTSVDDISPLAELNHLEEINLTATPIEDISPLAELKALEYLSLAGTEATDEQVNQLRQALPNCEIVR